MKVFDTEAALALADLLDSQYVGTYGKTTKHDNGGGLFYVVPASEGYVAQANDVTLSNGLVARWQQYHDQSGVDANIEAVVEAADLALAGAITIDGTFATDAISTNGAAGLTLPTISNNPTVHNGTPGVSLHEGSTGTTSSEYDMLVTFNVWSVEHIQGTGSGGTSPISYDPSLSANSRFLAEGNTVWTSGNDGAGSGLDADTLDGYQTSVATAVNTVVVRDASGNIDVTGLKIGGGTAITPAKELIPPQAYAAANTTLTFAHSLGVVPTLVTVAAICTTNDGDYVIGERIDLSASAPDGSTGSRGYTVEVSSTQIKVHIGQNGITINGKTPPNTTVALGTGDWNIEVTPVTF